MTLSGIGAVSWGVAAVLWSLAGLHVYWAFGGRRGFSAAVPEVDGAPLFRPGLGVTLVVAACLIGAGLVVLSAGGSRLAVFPPAFSRSATGMVAVIFLARSVGDRRYVGFLKKHRGTRFANLDTWLYSPLTLVLGLGAAAVALGAR